MTGLNMQMFGGGGGAGGPGGMGGMGGAGGPGGIFSGPPSGDAAFDEAREEFEADRLENAKKEKEE